MTRLDLTRIIWFSTAGQMYRRAAATLSQQCCMPSRPDCSQCAECRQTFCSSAALRRHMRGEHRAAGRFIVHCFVPRAFLVASSSSHPSRWDTPHYVITPWTLLSCSPLPRISPATLVTISMLPVLLLPIVLLLPALIPSLLLPVFY